MKIIEGDFNGCGGRMINDVFKGPILEIMTGFMTKKTIKIPSEISTIKLLHKDDKKNTGQNLLIIILALTLIGIPIAILLAILWKNVDFSVGIKTNEGHKFVLQGNSSDWTVIKKYIGLGSLDSF